MKAYIIVEKVFPQGNDDAPPCFVLSICEGDELSGSVNQIKAYQCKETAKKALETFIAIASENPEGFEVFGEIK